MRIKVYYSDHCYPCKSVIDYMDQKHVEYDKINVTTDSAKFAELLQYGGIATPQIVIDQKVVHSFDREKMDKMLEGYCS